MRQVKILTYLRENLTLDGENFVRLWGDLTPTDKEDLKRYAHDECVAFGYTVIG